MGISKIHPERSYINQSRAEKLLGRGYAKVQEQKWESAQSYFKRVREMDADECSTAFALVAIEACEAALISPGDEAKTAYEQVQRDRASEIPRDCLV